MRTLTRAMAGRRAYLARISAAEYDFRALSLAALIEVRDAIRIDRTFDPGELSPETQAELEAAHNDR